MTRHMAIIGSGAAGLSAAYHLRGRARLTLYEQDAEFGGHARTVCVPDGPDAGLRLDIGFMVMNARRYPCFGSMLKTLRSVTLAPSEMSFSYSCRKSGFEYAINKDDAPSNHAAMGSTGTMAVHLYGEIVRFGRVAENDLASGRLKDRSLGEYLDDSQVSPRLRDTYLLPMAASLWSAPQGEILEFPAQTYLTFFSNHGLLATTPRLGWQHLVGGSRTYVDALLEGMTDMTKRHNDPVTRVQRDGKHVVVFTETHAPERFDGAILATHADQALSLLHDASPEETAALGAIRYQTNDAILHCDTRVMPSDPSCWASWNYEREATDVSDKVCVSYHLNRLQNHRDSHDPYFLTLNRSAPIDERKILLRTTFTHPVLDASAIAAQRTLAMKRRHGPVAFAGSYFGYGFHEDAFVAGRDAASALMKS